MPRILTTLCVALLFLDLASCATQKPKVVKPVTTHKQVKRPVQAAETPATAAPMATSHIWISKPDGSKSCGAQSGIAPEQAAAELKKQGVKVFQQNSGHDGMMHMMVCGADTGATVNLLIDADQLDLVEKLGYTAKTKAP